MAALLFSTGGAAIKASSFGTWQVAGLRSGIAALVLLLAWPATRTAWTRRTLLTSVGYAATLVFFVLATKLTTAANAIFLQSAAPLYILLFGPLLLAEPSRRSDVAVAAVIMAGLGLFFVGIEQPRASAPDPALGNALAVASGVAWALTLMGMRWMSKPGAGAADSATAVVLGNVLAFTVALPLALPLPEAELTDWLGLVYLGVFQIGVAYVLVSHGLRHVAAFEASLILLLEPLLNPVWAWLMLGEAPGAWSLGGGALILGGTLVKSRLAARGGPAAEPSAVAERG